MNKLIQTCFYRLMNIPKIRTILSFEDTEKVIHAVVSLHLDYCNCLYT
uniref:Uncharacterized protein n=1 Tax=Anguilla anguilla TaxID=7936 RepID=A0A0E9W6K3_ANGAN